MTSNANLAARMSHQTTDAPTDTNTAYLIQAMFAGSWVTVGGPYQTPDAARAAALAGAVTAVADWRIVLAVSTWTTVDTSGM